MVDPALVARIAQHLGRQFIHRDAAFLAKPAHIDFKAGNTHRLNLLQLDLIDPVCHSNFNDEIEWLSTGGPHSAEDIRNDASYRPL